MKKLLLFAVLGVVIVNVAVPEPSWYRSKEIEFPDSRFISAIGSGLNPSDAESDAMRGIALFFNSTVNAQDELVSSFVQMVSSNRRNTRQEETRETALRSAITISTQAELRGVRFTSPWYNEQSRRYVVLGYIDKEEALQMYQNRINRNRSVIDTLLAASESETELLYQYHYLRNAAVLARLVTEDIRAVSDMSSVLMTDILHSIQRVITDYNTFRSRITFDVQINYDSNRRGRIGHTLFEILEKEGYVIAPNRGVYTITGTVSTSEQEFPAGVFVYPSITLQLVNSAGIELFPYSKNLPREGSISGNWDIAYNNAYRSIERDLETNFISQFNAFIGLN